MQAKTRNATPPYGDCQTAEELISEVSCFVRARESRKITSFSCGRWFDDFGVASPLGAQVRELELDKAASYSACQFF